MDRASYESWLLQAHFLQPDACPVAVWIRALAWRLWVSMWAVWKTDTLQAFKELGWDTLYCCHHLRVVFQYSYICTSAQHTVLCKIIQGFRIEDNSFEFEFLCLYNRINIRCILKAAAFHFSVLTNKSVIAGNLPYCVWLGHYANHAKMHMGRVCWCLWGLFEQLWLVCASVCFPVECQTALIFCLAHSRNVMNSV